MTFEEFRATREWHHDLGAHLPDYTVDRGERPIAGNVYVGSLCIEQVQDHWPEATRKLGGWYLLLGNADYVTDDLEALERRLYEYAQGEGMA